MDNSAILYSQILRFGNVFSLSPYYDPKKFLTEISQFDDQWKQYNPRKRNPRHGLSLTSLDGGFSGIPDLDSLTEYNRENETNIRELDIKIPTPAYEYAVPYLSIFQNSVCRSHVIRLFPGGFFPTHRDNHRLSISSFRIFVPLMHCNSTYMYFMLEDKILNFDHGRPYFFNSSLEHTLFNPSIKTVYFIVLNIEINEESVDSLLSNMYLI